MGEDTRELLSDEARRRISEIMDQSPLRVSGPCMVCKDNREQDNQVAICNSCLEHVAKIKNNDDLLRKQMGQNNIFEIAPNLDGLAGKDAVLLANPQRRATVSILWFDIPNVVIGLMQRLAEFNRRKSDGGA